ncbi:MAG TPA: TraM recognition domain-containing protein [Azospirillum sp.]
MAAIDYEREALRMMGLPHPADGNRIGFHELGTAELHASPDAYRAVIARRLERVRQALAAAAGAAPVVRIAIGRADFLAYGEYLSTLKRIIVLRERLLRRAYAAQHDAALHDPVPSAYADPLPPSPLEAQLARLFDPERHTPDWPGYLAYLAAVAPPLHQFFYRRLPVLLPEDARRRHSYITGQSGAGKSELLKVLLNAYLRADAPVSLVLIDPHGDLAEQVARLPDVAASNRLVYLHPALAPDSTPTINPFELADQSETAVHVMAEQIGSVFNELMRRAGHTSLSGYMGALLTPCVSTLLRRPGATIRDLQTFMDDKRNRDLWEAGCRAPVPAHRDFFEHQFFGKQFDSTKAALYTRIQSLLNSPVLYRLLVGPSTLDLEAAVNAGKIIIFALPKGGIGAETSPTFGAFVLAMLQGLAIRRERVPEHARVPIHVFVDECQNFLTPSVQTILTESRKYGLHLTLAQQTFAQDMDRDLAAAVVGNTAVKVCGMNDIKTLKPMDERMGVGLEALQRLSVGQFFVKVSGSTPAFKLLVPRIGARIGASAWAAVKAAQVRAYYRPNAAPPVDAPEPPATADRAGDGTHPAAAPITPARTPPAAPESPPARRAPPKPRKIDFV